MKRIIRMICILCYILTTFNACYSTNNDDVNEIIGLLNSNNEYNLHISDFTVLKKDYYIYSKALNDNLLLVFYCDNNNEIVQCTVTTNSVPDTKYYSLCRDISQYISKSTVGNINDFIDKINNCQAEKINGWYTNTIKNNVGVTFIINRINNDINSNTFPAIKEPINADDISRPKSSNINDNILP